MSSLIHLTNMYINNIHDFALIFKRTQYRGGLEGGGVRPGKLEMNGKNSTILILFIANKKPDETYNLNITK